LGVFEMIVLIVLISTAGKVLSRRSRRMEAKEDSPTLGRGEMEGVRESLDDLSGRLVRLEEERDFYKALLDAPQRQQGLAPPAPDSDASESTREE